MAKLPALQFYPGDWRKDMGIQSLDFFDRGVWFEMLLLMHESERRGVLVLNGEAMSFETIARAIGLDKQIFESSLSRILKFGVASIDEETGAIMNRRMVKDENLRKVRSESGSKGGNPVLVKQNPTTLVKQTLKMKMKTEEESSSGISSHMIAKTVMGEVKMSSPPAFIAIAEQAQIEIGTGDTDEENANIIASRMVHAWTKYREYIAAGKMDFQWAAQKFFGEGYWRDEAGWPWKKDARASPSAVGAWDGVPGKRESELEMFERIYSEAWCEKARRAHANGETLTKTQQGYIAALEEEDAKAKS